MNVVDGKKIYNMRIECKSDLSASLFNST